ncbi:PstS family phosphate ABC transporter substrate-binding protein [Rhodovibrio salinarum]|uniref:Phosphate ABC transporter substrate-binding protein n=1 Tax=Rhodovibrio salinarum TaxID=1087 RepID=A0A934UZR8_9PROT|nr:phosphate ABC transporter substrate-binding protein [Rhodovibrio salinarum]
MMKKTIALAAAVAAVTALPSGDAAAQARDQIRIVGSSTVYPFATSVVEQFGKETQYPTPVIESTGSGGGLKLFCAGVGAQHPDITNASRRIKPSEVKRCQENGVQKVTEVKIGSDGIVFANSVEGPKVELTTKQVWQALAAEVPQDGELVENPYETWSDIDSSLPDAKIEIYGPPPTSGTRDAFNEMAMLDGCSEFDMLSSMDESKMEEICLTYRSDGAWIEAGENDTLIVQKLTSNSNAFGIFGFSFLDSNRDKIQAAEINGYAPTVANISEDRYPLSRSLWFYVKNAHVGVIPGIEAYVKEFTSDATWGPNGYLVGKGLIPLPDEQREEWANKARNFEPLNPDDIAG